uniref:Myosuppressin n=1 Tax=Strigamia maritima TaxID=126957 RepID=T1IUA1_STRMM
MKLLTLYKILLVISVVIIPSIFSHPPPQCDTDDPLPPRLLRICNALRTISEYTELMEDYLDEEVMHTLAVSDMKRDERDTGHVFMRFG